MDKEKSWTAKDKDSLHDGLKESHKSDYDLTLNIHKYHSYELSYDENDFIGFTIMYFGKYD